MSTNMNLFFYENQHDWIKDHVDQKHENHESFFPEDDDFFSCEVARNYVK
jgi:hypothetical protein